uniref:Uncharacterized protein n=1 Tax=Timema douglasi TaxID=61478 RepID=A0A7R8VVB0_TIMDO|nr:unnamed protein product [Timema douglasi]
MGSALVPIIERQTDDISKTTFSGSDTMKTVVLVAAMVQMALGGGSQFAVRLPFLNPAGVPPTLRVQLTLQVPPHTPPPAILAYASHAPAAHVGYAAVPTVHHVPGVADVPVTRVNAQHGVIQKLVDVAKPAVQTRKFEVRRPAIQKQFYDVEERVVVRPAGSALVELEQPLSKTQKGPAVINPAAAIAYGASPYAHYGAGPIAHLGVAPVHQFGVVSSAPGPVYVGSTPAPALQDFPAGPSPSPPSVRIVPSAAPAIQARTNGASFEGLIPAPRSGGEVVPTLRDHLPAEVSQANQQRLIQLLTARGGIAEVGFGRSGAAEGPVGDAGQVRARVLSASSASEYAAPAGERVSTRRVVVSRPIETVQEFDVVEPVTKLERVAVNHPTVFKTLSHDVARVPTSVPVYGKTLTPTFSHATPLSYGYYH